MIRLAVLATGLGATLLPGLGPAAPPAPAAPRAPAVAPAGPAADDEQASLQELLERLRRERDERLKGLVDRVTTLLVELRTAVKDAGARAPDPGPRADLVALGPAAAPLLVRAIDPGPDATATDRRVARQVAIALRALPSTAVTDTLLELAQAGSLDGRRNALYVLGTSPDAERVGATVRELWASAEGELREATLVALASLGGAENRALIVAALADEDEAVVTTALRALAEARSAEAAGEVLALARDVDRARGQVAGILNYLTAVPDAVESEHLDALLALVEDRRVPEQGRVDVLEALPDFDREVTSDHKRRIRDLTRSGRRDVAEAAMVAAAILGDSRIERELLAPYDDDVERNEQWAAPWHARAEIHYRIRDYRNAVRDFKQALKLARDDRRTEVGELYVGLARAYAAQGKDRDAARTLEDAPISRERLKELAREEVFAELVASDRYRPVFGLDED